MEVPEFPYTLRDRFARWRQRRAIRAQIRVLRRRMCGRVSGVAAMPETALTVGMAIATGERALRGGLPPGSKAEIEAITLAKCTLSHALVISRPQPRRHPWEREASAPELAELEVAADHIWLRTMRRVNGMEPMRRIHDRVYGFASGAVVAAGEAIEARSARRVRKALEGLRAADYALTTGRVPR